MWAKVKAACGHSLTMAWSYLLIAFGAAMQGIDLLAVVLNDPTVTSQVAAVLHADPKMLGAYSMIVGAVTAIARARSLARG